MNRLASDELTSNNVYVDSIKNNDGVKFLNRTESIKKYFSGETILPYDWAPDYENTFSIFDSTGYTAQCNGWMSIDRTEVSPSSIFINGNITNTFSNNGSVQLFLSKGDIVTASSLFDFTFSPSISDGKISFDFNGTPYDIWSAIPVKTEDGLTLLKNLHIPNASAWSIKVREPNNLIITKILDNKAYNGDTFVCNIQFEKIKFASNLFSYCEALTSFDSELSSLEDAPGMFFNCNLDSQSVEKILSSIPTYTSGEHTLTLTIQESAKEKFQEITGQTIELGNFYDISYKGWKINIFIRDNRSAQTPYDIYKNAITIEDDGSISIKNLYIPDASAWNKEIYQQYELTITSVNSDKAYNGDTFICNIQSEYIENGDNLFNGVSSLTSFTDNLSSLSSGVNMFNECSLNSISVETILSTIPTYTDGEHILTMRVSGDAAEKFKEITGITEVGEELSTVSFKGWTIQVNKIIMSTTEYDIWEGTPYIPDASNWRADVYNKNNIRITDVKDNKIFNGDEIVANIQCENIETDATLNLSNMTGLPVIPSLFSNTHLKSFEGDLSSLKIPLATFANTNITNFDSDLSNVTFAPFGLFGGCFDLTDFNSDLSNLVMSEMGLYTVLMFEEDEMSEMSLLFPSPISFINTGLTSFDGDLSSLVCSNMFIYCDKLENFSSDISSLGDFSKLYEHPEIIDWFKTMGLFPADYVLPSIDLWGEMEMIIFAINYMFMGCNLNSTSVEHILNSLTSYNDGFPRMLGMTINSSAVPTFTQITGATFEGNFCDVTFKGWSIMCQIKEEFVPTELDVVEGSPYCHDLKIMYAGGNMEGITNTYLYKLITSEVLDSPPILQDDKICTESGKFVCNFQSEKIVSSIGITNLFSKILINGFPKLKYNMNFLGFPLEAPYFFSDLRSLEVDMNGFSGSDIMAFCSSLHSLVCSMGTFDDCQDLQIFFSDLRSLCCGESMFAGCSNLTSFNVGLFSLGDVEKFVDTMYDFYLYIMPVTEGVEPPTKEDIMQLIGENTFGGGMFTGCKLDAPSVENILTSIPEWNDEIYRELGMTIQSGEAATKFGEITGIIPASTEIIEVPFKGWNIKVNLYSA